MAPHLILGIALLGFYNLLAVDLSLVPVIMGRSVVAFPYVFLIVSARLVGFDPLWRRPPGASAPAPPGFSGKSRFPCRRRPS
jgi:hypothetical protein